MKNKLLILLSIASITLCGCEKIISLTDQETVVIGESVANYMLKYGSPTKRVLLQPGEIQVKLEEKKAKDEQDEEILNPGGNKGNTTNDNKDPNLGVSEFAKDGCLVNKSSYKIKYKNYKVVSTYKDQYMSYTPKKGKKFVVINADIINKKKKKIEIDFINSTAPTFSLYINDTKAGKAERTIMLKDVSTFSDHIKASGKFSGFILFEVESSLANNISTAYIDTAFGKISTKVKLK